jgi:hypothetical protein
MKEVRLYNFAMLSGIAILIIGLAIHSWKVVAFGAMLGGIGGLFGALSNSKSG